MHACTVSQRNHAQEIAHLLDPCYHIDTSKCSPASPCPSMLSTRTLESPTTWKDATGRHDPDFRPFATSRRLSFPTQPLPPSPRSSFDLPLAPAMPPSKAERAAARRELNPALREALKAHERQLAKERCEERRPAWLKRHRSKSSDSALDYNIDVEEVQDDASFALSPPPLPELVFDYGSDDEDDSHEDHADEKPSPRDQIRHQLASITLRVDLAVFRAKKRLRRRVGLE
ncbi:hypothetical protein AURDEDRAFT_112701 [Auricularia subglabra TFB-10046 SS5]|nr:hypothetical protein AURDEDRAFT_112701 [Auricularia subglabra TFB-10046 SS5]